MDIQNLKKLTKTELVDRLNLKKGELFQLRYDIRTGKEANISKSKELKKEIARISTIINISSAQEAA